MEALLHFTTIFALHCHAFDNWCEVFNWYWEDTFIPPLKIRRWAYAGLYMEALAWTVWQ